MNKCKIDKSTVSDEERGNLYITIVHMFNQFNVNKYSFITIYIL